MGCRQSRARYCRLQDRIDVLVSLAVQVMASLNHRGKLATHASEAVSLEAKWVAEATGGRGAQLLSCSAPEAVLAAHLSNCSPLTHRKRDTSGVQAASCVKCSFVHIHDQEFGQD